MQLCDDRLRVRRDHAKHIVRLVHKRPIRLPHSQNHQSGVPRCGEVGIDGHRHQTLRRPETLQGDLAHLWIVFQTRHAPSML